MGSKFLEMSLEELEQHEGAAVTLPRFNSEIAWEMGTYARTLAQEYSAPLLIDITLSSGQVLFHAGSRNGLVVDNDNWINRKKRTTLRYAKSSFYMGQKVKKKALPPKQAIFADEMEYALHGGSVPIRIEGFDNVVGAFTVSGLPPYDDHDFVLRVLAHFKSKLSEKA